MKSVVRTLQEMPVFNKKSKILEENEVVESYVLFETADILVMHMFFRAGESLKAEKHSPHEKVICLNGNIQYEIQGEKYVLERNANIDIPANRIHSCCAGEKGAEIIVILSKNQYFENFF